MAGRRAVESPLSSQSSLSGPPSAEEGKGRMTRSTRGTRVIGDSDDMDTSDRGAKGEEEENGSVVSGEDDDGEDDGGEDDGGEDDGLPNDEEEEEEEADELDEEDELEDDNAKEYGGRSRRGQASSKKARSVPTRQAAATATKRNVRAQNITEDVDESLSDGSEPQATPSSRSKRITLRLSGHKDEPVAKKRRGRPPKGAQARGVRGPTSRRGRARVEDDDEEEGEEIENIDASSEDFENDNSFASLPKTARQLAKERAAQGIGSPESEAQEPMDDIMEDGKKQQMAESELALKRSEMARRRRNQTEKKLEDDKIETINRLLKKQVSRRNNRADGDDSDGENDEDGEARAGEKRGAGHGPTALERKQQPQPFFRYIQSTRGPSTLSMPVEEVPGPYKRKWDELFGASRQTAAQ